jgi:hypothetical protein
MDEKATTGRPQRRLSSNYYDLNKTAEDYGDVRW